MGAEIKQMRSGNCDLPPIKGKPLVYTDEALTFGEGFGLPDTIEGDPLGCGCDEAHLVGVGELNGNEIEADYNCDSGWHNYVVFTVAALTSQQTNRLDANGNLIGGEGFSAGELEEY